MSGAERESTLTFAGLHQLVAPLRTEIDALPPRQRAMLLSAIGFGDDPLTPDPMLVAVLTLLSDLADATRLLVVVDDVHWVDRASVNALAFVARRLEAVPAALPFRACDVGVPAGLDRNHPVIALGPLDAQPDRPAGGDRVRLLAHAAGNPLALVELATTHAEDALPEWASDRRPDGPRVRRAGRQAAGRDPARLTLAGQSAWALDLTADVDGLTDDPAVRALAALRSGGLDWETALKASVEAARDRRELRREARKIVAEDPDMARELGIGRPDVQRDFDDGGLVDVNSVPAEALIRLPGITAAIAERIVQTREARGPYGSVEELSVFADLPPYLADRLAEYLVFLD